MIKLKNPKALYHDYIPQQLPHRESQLKFILDQLKLAEAGLNPPHMLLLGPAGSGKTVTMLKALKLIMPRSKLAYLVSSHSPSLTLDRMAELLIGRRTRGWGLDGAWDLICSELGDQPLILILDEIDRLFGSERVDELIYHISRRPSTCLIGISNRINIYGLIKDPRVRSSFLPKPLMFESYTAPELVSILESRAQEAFAEPKYDPELIPEIARLAVKRGGDARYAIDLLRGCLELAIQQSKQSLDLELLEEARNRIEFEYIQRGILSLREPQRLLLYIVLRNAQITISEIARLYNCLAPEHDLEQLSSKWISNYLGELEKLGFIKISSRGAGRARGVKWWVELGEGIPPESVRQGLRALGYG